MEEKKGKQVLWAGRLEKKPAKEAFDFQASIGVDYLMAEEDIAGSKAHVKMLGDQKIIPKETAAVLIDELSQIDDELKCGKLTVDASCEDVHSFIEGVLTERLGEAGRMVHAGRSRNDQVVLDFKLYCKKRAVKIQKEIKNTIAVLLDAGNSHLNTIMPGFTHLQRAQPVTLAHHLTAWACALKRDAERFTDALSRLNECPLGAGALAGSTLPLDRNAVASALGFERPALNSMDAVAARDFVIELASCCAITQINLSRFCEDIVIWASEEFGFINLAEEWSTGSSIMPQKKNPDFAELIRGKSARATGNLTALLTLVKGLPYAYNKDLQEDKEALFDSFETLEKCLFMFSGMIKTAGFNAVAMKAACVGGFLEATDCAEYLVKAGTPFRKAHEISAAIVRACVKDGLKSITEMPLERLKTFSPLFESGVYELLTPQACVKGRSLAGGPAPEETARQIAALREFLTNF
ncbi:MAG: argininosuccinate lyase [Spirochaetaceae bacterium]|jgi:argininosuccinate lyase|nr:argininosuccinate lyase [Spirochaetaceae bacterium]